MATDQSWDEPPAVKQSRLEDELKQPQLGDLLRVIPHALMDEQCSEKFLSRVAKHLTQWRLLRPFLEMSDSDEDNIIENFPTTELRKQRCLLRWRKKFGKEATYRALVTVIFEMGNVDLAWKVCQMAKEFSVGGVAHTHFSSLANTSLPPAAMASTSSSASSHTTAMPLSAVATAPPFSVIISYQDQLRHGYRTHKPVMVVEWPPPPALKYVRLAMIKKDKVGRGTITKEDICTAIQGDVDGILHKKIPVEVDQLFSLDSERRKVILVEGAPGSGKSTLLWHICQKWESGELFQQFTLVLLVLLRDTAVHTAQCLADMLPFIPSRSSKYTPSEYRKTIASDIEDRHGEGALIMLDGWDEAPANLQQEGSLIHDIITEPSKCSLEAAAVVVSSRPSASNDIRKYVSTRLEIVGFTQERRKEYVQEILQDKPEAACSLLQQIESVPQLGQNCHLPLNLVIITHTFMCSEYSLPSTYCRIIITLALSCLLRHIKKSTPLGKTVKSQESFIDLPDGIREEFIKLCKLAYKGVVKEKYSFSCDDMREMTQLSSTGMPQITTLGLLQAVHSLVATGSSTVYHFLHLSLQELCAAHYITTLPSPETQHVEALKRMVTVEESSYGPQCVLSTHFQSVCEFYSALTHLGNPQVVSQLLDIYKDEASEPWDSHPQIICDGANFTSNSFFECLAEAENTDLTGKTISRSLHIEYITDKKRALASAIALAPHLESFSCVCFPPAIIKALSGKKSLKSLVISYPPPEYSVPHMSYIDMECVKHVLLTCASIEHFGLNGEVGDNEVSDLAELLNQTSIRTLDLNYSDKVEAGIEALSKALKTNTTIQHITLDCRGGIGEAGIIALSSGLKTNTTIQHLTVGCKDIGPHGQEVLAVALSQNTCTSLTTLKIVAHGSQDPGPFTEDDRTIFSCLKKIPSLIKFSIVLCSVLCCISRDMFSMKCPRATYVGRTLLSGNLVELADILKLSRPPAVNKQMDIDLYNRVNLRVDFKSMCFIHLKVSSYGEERCEVGCGEGMNQLNERLTKVVVVELDFSNHKIGNIGAKHLANVMVMEKVDISECGIGEEGIVALSSALNKTTFKCLKANGNMFGDKGASHLAMALDHTPLEEIDISDCGIGEDGMVALSSALKANTMLKCLKVHGNYFGDKGPTSLAVALSHKMLLEMDISDCGIGEDGMIAVVSALSTNTTLKCLKASGNSFGNKGASQLAMALGHTQLEEIDISDCGIGEDGMVALSLGLKTNTTLKCLTAFGNSFGDKGASQLAKALGHTQLKEIDISGCGIGEDGMMALSSALETNTILNYLNISGNNSRDEGIIALSSALCTNTTLTHLNVSLRISGRSRVALARAILQNTSLTTLNDNRDYLIPFRVRRPQGMLKNKYTCIFTCEETQKLLKDCNTFYTSIKRSPIVLYISINRTTSLGAALWSGNMEEAAEILELSLPPAVEKRLYIHMSNNIWCVDYGARNVVEKDEGLLKIRSIYNNPSSWSDLHNLTLKHMVLGGVGACLLAEMLNETQLRELDVSYCCIPEDGIVALSLALSTNTTLEYLAIGGNCINECGQEALAGALMKNTTLTVLDISACNTLYKSFKGNGQVFFEYQNEYSLSEIIFDLCYCTDETDVTDHLDEVIVLNLKTSKSTFLPTSLRHHVTPDSDIGEW